MTSTVTVLISMNTDRDFIYRRSADEKNSCSTRGK